MSWVALGRRHVRIFVEPRKENTHYASMLLASFNNLPFDNLNPELGNAGIGGIGNCGKAGKLGVVMFPSDGVLFVVSSRQQGRLI